MATPATWNGSRINQPVLRTLRQGRFLLLKRNAEASEQFAKVDFVAHRHPPEVLGYGGFHPPLYFRDWEARRRVPWRRSKLLSLLAVNNLISTNGDGIIGSINGLAGLGGKPSPEMDVVETEETVSNKTVGRGLRSNRLVSSRDCYPRPCPGHLECRRSVLSETRFTFHGIVGEIAGSDVAGDRPENPASARVFDFADGNASR